MPIERGHELIIVRSGAPSALASRTHLDAVAILAAKQIGFRLGSILRDGAEMYFQRFCGVYVDLMELRTGEDEASICQRFERRFYPWKADDRPECIESAYGSIVDVVRQIHEWPTF
jgi:hypothetical protein